MNDNVELLKRRLERERAARRQAESIAERKTRDIYQLSEQRMTALGVLVGGVAHEVNTPIGLAYTSVTHAHDQLLLIQDKLRAGVSPNDEGLARCLRQMDEGLGYASSNLQKVAQLIEGFKQVAVDQTSDMRRSFDLGSYLREIVNTLKPMLRKGGHEVRIHVPEPIALDSFPGALSQIVTNIIVNAVVHGFDGRADGVVGIEAEMKGSSVCCLSIEDDGKGMPLSVTRRVFEPFFTTRRGEGGCGLGLHIVYNLVTQRMGGLVCCESVEGKGTRFILHIPLSAGGGLPEPVVPAVSDSLQHDLFKPTGTQ